LLARKPFWQKEIPVVQVTALAVCLQELFGPLADFLAGWVGFIQRRRALTGQAVARALVFRWMADPKATLEDIASDLGVSPQALQQHLDKKAHDFFRALISEALARLAKARFAAHALGLLKAFPAVVVDDCTTVSLPADLAHLFPGCGGGKQEGDGAAAVKILLRYELKAGKLLALSFHPGRTNDADLAACPEDLPPGCLYLADMGFFSAARLGLLGKSCAWITRIPAGTCVRQEGGRWLKLGGWLRGLQGDVADVPGELAESVRTPCRLVALRCPEEVANRRRQKLREQRKRKDGKEPSEAQLAACDWTCMATNVGAAVLTAREVWLAYRCRWQIELLFKRAKGMAGWSFSHGESGDRVMAELLAKVLGLVVLHWATLLRGPALCGVSATRLMRKAAEFAKQMSKALTRSEEALLDVLREMLGEMTSIKPRPKRRRRPNTKDLLDNPGLATPQT
jgi:AcrR family transcriptional regulator